jgi:YVTN family beta-propeller protein
LKLLLSICAVLACGGQVPIYAGADFSSDPPRPGPLGGLIVTTNNGDDTVSVIDPATRAVRWSIPLGFIPVELEGPHHLSADPAGAFLYVNLSEAVAGSGNGPHGAHGTGTIPGYVLKLETGNAAIVASTRVDPSPGDNTLSADGKTLYVTHYDLTKWTMGAAMGDLRKGDSNLFAIDTETMAVKSRVPLCPAAHGARLSADETTLYATCGPDEIAIAHLGAQVTVDRVLLPGATEGGGCDQCPYALSVAPDATVWVSTLGPNGGGSGGGGIHVYDPQAGFDGARTVSLCGRAVFAAFTKLRPASDYRAYVPEQGTCGDLIRIYAPGGPGVAPVPAGTISLAPSDCLNAHMMLLSEDDRVGYLVCEGNHVGPGTLVFLDLEIGTVIGSVPIGIFPDGLTLVPRS